MPLGGQRKHLPLLEIKKNMETTICKGGGRLSSPDEKLVRAVETHWKQIQSNCNLIVWTHPSSQQSSPLTDTELWPRQSVSVPVVNHLICPTTNPSRL